MSYEKYNKAALEARVAYRGSVKNADKGKTFQEFRAKAVEFRRTIETAKKVRDKNIQDTIEKWQPSQGKIEGMIAEANIEINKLVHASQNELATDLNEVMEQRYSRMEEYVGEAMTEADNIRLSSLARRSHVSADELAANAKAFSGSYAAYQEFAEICERNGFSFIPPVDIEDLRSDLQRAKTLCENVAIRGIGEDNLNILAMEFFNPDLYDGEHSSDFIRLLNRLDEERAFLLEGKTFTLLDKLNAMTADAAKAGDMETAAKLSILTAKEKDNITTEEDIARQAEKHAAEVEAKARLIYLDGRENADAEADTTEGE